ncbi:hypothetical protein SLA2020_310600 [Shorea laevis]
MAAPACKNSGSPNCSRQKPNARSSELNNNMRRSFTGNPFSNKPSVVTIPRGFNPNTPANSPSDFPRRHSMGRESLTSMHDYEDKENGKDQGLKLGRVRSPAPSKGTKNFMSPTISAASKITVSPRKKILSERNEPARSSVSFSDVRSLIMEDSGKTAPKIDVKQDKIEDLNDSLVMDGHKELLKSDADDDSKVSKNDSESLSESITDDKDFVNVDPSFKISPRVSFSPPCPPLAPLDADPLMPPYDPKTNYLSPRPQFLHYRPNPRIERYRERGGRQLEESFQSESFSETEFTEETQTEDSQRESEEAASSEMIKEEEEEDLLVSEPKPSIGTEMDEKSVEAKVVSKPHFFTRSKLITLLLVLAMAYFSISASDSSAFAPSMFNDWNPSKLRVPFEVIESVKANFNELAQNLRHWSADTLSYILKMISSLSEVPKLGPLRYANLSSVPEDQMGDSYLIFDQSVLDSIQKKEVINEALDERYDGEIEADEIDEEEVPEEDSEPGFEDREHQEVEVRESFEVASEEESENVHQGIEAEVIKPDRLEADHSGEVGTEFAADGDIGPQSSVDLGGQEGLIPRATKIQPAESKPEEPGTVSAQVEVKPGNPEMEASREKSPEMELQTTTRSSEAISSWQTMKASVDKLSTHNLLGISLLVLCLLASVALIYKRKRQPSSPKAAVPVEQPVLAKKPDHCPASVSVEHTYERLSSRNWETEVDMVNEYCPSEMSSYGNSASYNMKKGHKEASGEAQNQKTKPKKNYKRESLASSDCSMGSPSYGSYTTYEKIPSKQGVEEIVTPVRRSSRIRSQATSSP